MDRIPREELETRIQLKIQIQLATKDEVGNEERHESETL